MLNYIRLGLAALLISGSVSFASGLTTMLEAQQNYRSMQIDQTIAGVGK